ncbi:MAG: glutamate racemase [Acidimicrobiia bacterium]
MELTPRIAVLDSGIGGTGVLNAIRERAPWADIAYVADHAFGPYGERSLEEVRSRTEVLARYLATAGAEMIVIACNSASAAALHHLRSVMPDIEFVGMEPAVKPAAEMTTAGVVGVMATGATFQGELFLDLVGRHGDDVEIVEQACPGLAAAVEAGDDPGPLLDRFLPTMVEAGADVVVLGCTHYPLIREEIASRLPDGVVLIDPAPAVARRVTEVARMNDVDLQGSAATRWWSTALALPVDDTESGWEPIDIPDQALGSMCAAGTTLSAMTGDLTRMATDAIVNAANTSLMHGGGIALAIVQAGGPDIDAESAAWVEEYGPLEPGVAALTSAGAMPASYVIHTAGPVYTEGQDNESLLGAAAMAAVDTASEIGVRTMAMPAISAGIYGYPPDEATAVLVAAVAEFVGSGETSLASVRFVGYDDTMAQRFASAIRSLVGEA